MSRNTLFQTFGLEDENTDVETQVEETEADEAAEEAEEQATEEQEAADEVADDVEETAEQAEEVNDDIEEQAEEEESEQSEEANEEADSEQATSDEEESETAADENNGDDQNEQDDDDEEEPVTVAEVEFVSDDEEADAEAFLEEVRDEDTGEQEEELAERDAETIEDLQTSNESYLAVLRAARNEGKLTPHLCASVEAHVNRVCGLLSVAKEHTVALESFDPNVSLESYAEALEMSLEGFGDVLSKAFSSVSSRVAKGYHAVGDLVAQRGAYRKLVKLADRALDRLSEMGDKKAMVSSGAQTRWLSSNGAVVSNLSSKLKDHVKAMEEVITDFAPKCVQNADKIGDLVLAVASSHKDNFREKATAVKAIPQPASLVKPAWRKGDAFLGNLKIDQKGDLGSYDSIGEYLKARAVIGQPQWVTIKSSATKEVSMNTAEAKAILNMIRAHAAKMEAGYRALVKRQGKDRSRMLNVANTSGMAAGTLPGLVTGRAKVSRLMVRVYARELGGILVPSASAVHKDLPVLRGVIAFINRFVTA